jgi:hypothetical protein
MSEGYQCDLCQDSRHVLENGVWVRCSCLKELATSIKYARAGLTFPVDQLINEEENIRKFFPDYCPDEDVRCYVANIQNAIAAKRCLSRTFCFSGRATSPKDFIVQCLLKTAVDAGFKVVQLSLDSLINNHFKPNWDKEEEGESFSMLDEFAKADVFSLYFGSEIQFRIGENYLTEIIRAHRLNFSNKTLLLNTSLSYSDLAYKYNDTFQSMFVEFNKDLKTKYTSQVVFLSVR